MWPPVQFPPLYFACVSVGWGIAPAAFYTFFARSFHRLRAARYFPSDGKVPKGSPGDAADGLRLRFAPPRSIGLLSPGPPLRRSPLSVVKKFPARGDLCAWVLFIPGPQGPWVCKNWNWYGSRPAPGLSELTVLVRISRRRGGSQTRPPRRIYPHSAHNFQKMYQNVPQRGKFLPI